MIGVGRQGPTGDDDCSQLRTSTQYLVYQLLHFFFPKSYAIVKRDFYLRVQPFILTVIPSKV